MSPLRRCVLMPCVAAAAVALAACSGQSSNTPAAGQGAQPQAAETSTNEAAADKKLKMFHKLMGMKQPQLAVQIGQEIVDQYPHTKAAAKIGKVLPKLKAKAAAEAKEKRLANLWLYQVSPVGGGTQSTATINNSKPDDVKVRLVLRRQTEWGTSAFLYDAPDKGFVCHNECNIVMHFDGKRHVYKGFLPDGGEPAMFIKDDKGFIQRLKKADKVDMQVTIKGKGPQTLVFETGGFDAGKWKPLPKS